MDKERKLIVLYTDWIDALERRSDAVRLEVLDAIFAYERQGTVPTQMTEIAQVVFDTLRPYIDKEREKYEDICKRNRENILKRWNKSNTTDTKNTTGTSGKSGIESNTTDTKNTINTNTNTNTSNIATTNVVSMCDSDESHDETINLTGIIEYWNMKMRGTIVPLLKTIQGTRKGLVLARIKQYSKQDFATAIDKASASDWFTGRVDGRCRTFDWMVCPNNFPKVLEGNYDNKPKINGYGTDNRTTGAEQRATEAASLVARLLAEDDARSNS